MHTHLWSMSPDGVTCRRAPRCSTPSWCSTIPRSIAWRPAMARWSLGRLTIEQHSSYPFNLVVQPGEDLVLKLMYAPGYIDDEVVVRLGSQLEHLLGAMAADPERALGALCVLPEPERRKVLFQWNATTVGRAQGMTLHRLFEEQARRSPEAVAVSCGDEQVTLRPARSARQSIGASTPQKGRATRHDRGYRVAAISRPSDRDGSGGKGRSRKPGPRSTASGAPYRLHAERRGRAGLPHLPLPPGPTSRSTSRPFGGRWVGRCG